MAMTPAEAQKHKVTPSEQKAAKTPVWQGVFAYFSNALDAVGAISKFGCVKHNNGNMPTKWREYPVTIYADALARHIVEEGKGNLYDSESHMLHAGHEAWNALARLEKLLETNPLVEELKTLRVLQVRSTTDRRDGGYNYSGNIRRAAIRDRRRKAS